MQYRTVTERIGERLGDIDWNYDFASHRWTSSRGGINPELVPREVEMLRQVESALKEGKRVQVTTYGDHLNDVVDCGMYDGWPHWKPVPSFQIRNWLGVEWHGFYSLGRVVIEDASNGK